MRLECETEIGYRLLEYQRSGATSKKKAAFTILTLCRKPGEAKQQKPTTYLLLCTSKNPAGTKYKIHDNVERLFTKFITQGKATIQLREPKHNLIISKADISELRRFLNLINLAHHGKDLDQSAFSGPPSKVTPTKETLVVRHRKDYPSGGFPKTLKKLTIELTVLPDTMCCARKLTTLVVRSNRLQKLPHGLGFMPCLSVLDVTSNALNLLPASLLMGTLSSISICDNPMDGAMGGPLVSTDANTHQRPLWLLQLAAQAAAASGYGRKVKLTAEDVPRCLLELLCTATPCYSCKKFVIPAAALSVILRMDLSQMVSSCGTYARGSAADVMVPVQANICSYMCLPQ
ncbi:leucine-rich repeat protein 1-like isoform X2 [Rhipicephalus sanguineus]|uniref:leucine-rich repeat protein 1-like isoform X2 n=1 Tax=Rhipicephalus sanguineus TaxID=34632 RepID=UPI0020C2FCED|nr:leucine-rich repeat protein 1-like isoform X2 [Rhipicephalus sanguineus]